MRFHRLPLVAVAPLSLWLFACDVSHVSTTTTTGAGGGDETSSVTTGTGVTSSATTGASSTSSTGGSGPMHTHGPLTNLTKVGTAEYSTGLLLSDGRILMESGQVTPVLAPLNVPAGTTFLDYAGGLHQSVAIDSTHHVWTWGATDSGLQGSGMNGGDPSVPYKITSDATGADFTDVASVVGGYAYDGAVKSDGSVWVWGNLATGLTGDGTEGGVVMKPTKVPFPAGVKIKKLVYSNVALALAEDGTVWSWGGTNVYGFPDTLGRKTTDGTTPGKVEGIPSNVVDIASGGSFSYALTSDNKLFGWGWNTKLGVSDPNNITRPPTDMSTIVSLPAPVKFVAANDHTTHVILTDGSLWGWGDDAEGEVGDGHEIDFGAMGPHSGGTYAWDWGNDDMPVMKPVRIASDVSNFKAVFTNTAFVFYVFAVTEDGYLYSWGRNKTGDLMNGIVSAAPLYGNISAQYPNSWDVTSPENVNPMELMSNKEVTSPYCLTHATDTPCNQFNNATGKAVYEN